MLEPDGTLTGIDVDPVGGSMPRDFTQLGDLVVFSAQTVASGREPWVSDGTVGGTRSLGDLAPGNVSSNPAEFVAAEGRIFFTAEEPTAGRELWVTDGTAAGTRRVADIRPGVLGSDPRSLVAFGGGVLLSANDGVVGDELWASDGTALGTRLVGDLNPGANNSSPDELTLHDGAVYFRARDRNAGIELWITDGTSMGTALFADIHPSGDSRPTGLVSFFDQLLFAANVPGVGIELFGTLPGGTVGLVMDIRPGPASSSPSELVAGGGRLWFRADDGIQGSELWWSGGAGATTASVGDIRPGGSGSQPTDLCPFGSRCYFVADDGSGSRLWKTDTAARNPQPVCSLTTPRELTRCGCRLFCGAIGDPMLSIELYAVDDPGAAVFEVGAGCLPGMTFRCSTPRIGTTMRFSGRNAPGGTGLVLFDAELQAPQPLPGPGCVGRVRPLVVLGPIVGAASIWGLQVPIPNDPALSGVCLLAQSWWVAPSPLAIVTTSTLLLNLGM